MSTRYLIPLCAAAALLAACGPRDENRDTGGDTSDSATTPGTMTTPDGTTPDATTPDATTPGATPDTTTPGTTPDGTTAPQGETAPANPPPSPGGG